MTVSVEVSSTAPPDTTVLVLPAAAGDDGPVLLAERPAAAGALPATLGTRWFADRGFAAGVAEVLTVSPVDGPTVVLVGLGDVRTVDAERWRRAAAAVVRSVPDGAVVVLALPGADAPAEPGDRVEREPPGGAGLGAAVAEGAVLGAYRFDEYRSGGARPGPGPGPARLVLLAANAASEADALADGVTRGSAVAAAVCVARDLVNTPPSDLSPRRFAERVTGWLAGRDRVTVDVWDEQRITEERLGGLAGVNRGSSEPARLVRADYRPAGDPDAVPLVVLVGKGITFDSGGLSLKSAEGMMTMKTDMTGAAVMLATLAACADLGLPVRVTAITPLTENMPGGSAIKPGDVLTIRNGATIEVLNTDAEGRLVLADGLVLAGELGPDVVIDAATLTGAAVAALGTSIGALFGNDDALLEEIRRSGERAGERLWPLPLAADVYGDHIESEVADMKNIGKPGQAGAISAALLLARFVGDVPWAHLDIAGPARSAESSGYLAKGGTAFGVRTLVELLASHRGPWG